MATRSRIAVRNTTDEGFKSVYVHWDGSPDTRMPILNTYWMDESKVRELIAGGSISSLQDTIADTIFYSRDRGEDLVVKESTNFTDLKWNYSSMSEEYLYVFDNGEWSVYE